MTFEVGDEKTEFILSKFLKAPSMDESCCEIDIIDECIRELDKEEHIETIKLPSTPIMEDNGFKSVTPYIDDSLNECLTLTPAHMPSIKEPTIELKEIPKNLRYEFLDEEINCPVIVNAYLNSGKTD